MNNSFYKSMLIRNILEILRSNYNYINIIYKKINGMNIINNFTIFPPKTFIIYRQDFKYTQRLKHIKNHKKFLYLLNINSTKMVLGYYLEQNLSINDLEQLIMEFI